MNNLRLFLGNAQNISNKFKAFNLPYIFSKSFSNTSSKMMHSPKYQTNCMILDIGTSNTKVRIYDNDFNVITSKKRVTEILVPEKKASEIDPLKLWNDVIELCKESIESEKFKPKSVKYIGITNQRESFLLWDKSTGAPVSNIITWQDRRAVDTCKELNEFFSIMAYKQVCNRFSGSLNNRPISHAGSFKFHPNMAAVRLYHFLKNNRTIKRSFLIGKLCFGTVESWISYNLTNRKKYVSDYANTSITGLYNPFYLKYRYPFGMVLNIVRDFFPKVVNTHGSLFDVDENIFGFKIPVTCMIGDQQASTFGCGCVEEGMVKATLGTGLFIDLYMDKNVIPQMKGNCYPLIGWYSSEGNPNYIYETRSDFANDHIYQALITYGISSVKTFDEILNSQGECTDYKIEKDRILRLLNKTIFIFYDVWKEFYDNVKELYYITHIKMDGGYSTSDYLVKGIASICNINVKRMTDIESTSNGTYYLSRIGYGLNDNHTEFNKYFSKTETIYPDKSIGENLLKIYEEGWQNRD